MAEKRLVLVNFEASHPSQVSFQFQVDMSKMGEFSNDRQRLFSAIQSQQDLNDKINSQDIELLLESTDFPGASVRLPDSPLSHKSVVKARLKRQPLSELSNMPAAKGLNSSLTDLGDIFNGPVGTQLQSGRPPAKKAKTLDRPTLSLSNVSIDWISFRENVAKMITFHSDAPNHPSLESLYRLTFIGRRARLTGGEFEGNAPSLIVDECPLLAYEHYLCEEMDQILKKDDNHSAVAMFKDKWKSLVPKIISLAEQHERSCKNMRNLLQSRRDYEDGTIAMQLLVLFLPGNVKSVKGFKYLIEIIDDSENMTTAAEKLPRMAPFIIRCGRNFHIVVDSKPVIHLSDDPTNALVCLIATFYAFHIHWTNELRFLFSFLEIFLLDQPVQCDKTTKAKLDKFNRLLGSMNIS